MPHIHALYDFVVSVFVVYQNRVLLVYHKKYSEWLPIGGHIELNEDPEQALYREIKEESGMRVRILTKAPSIAHDGVKPIPTPSFVDAHRISRTHKHIAFIYFGVSKSAKIRLHTREHREYRWFSKKDLLDRRFGLTRSIRFYCREALKRAALCSLIFLTAANAFAGQRPAGGIEYAKVLDATGTAEIYPAPTSGWEPIRKDSFLKGGGRLRTGPGSQVQIILDSNFESVAKIGGNSRARFLTVQPFEIVLEQGTFFIFNDRATADSEPPLKIQTHDASMILTLGGCQVVSSKQGVLIKVFADQLQVSIKAPGRLKKGPQTVREGFKCFISHSTRRLSLKRMTYRDYANWQVWMQKIYEIKDDAMDE